MLYLQLNMRHVNRGHPSKGPLSREELPCCKEFIISLAEVRSGRFLDRLTASSPLPILFECGVGDASPHQAPIRIKAHPEWDEAPSAVGGPENLGFQAVSKYFCTDLVVINQPLGGSRSGR
jgi:hypothetical protein